MSKYFKYLFYVFIIAVIGIFVMNANFKDQTWGLVVMIVCISIAALIFLGYLSLMLYCFLDNKKIDKMLNLDKYDELILYCQKDRKFTKTFLSERMNYYNYLLLLSYFAKDDAENIIIHSELMKKHMDYYPMIYYWTACYEFAQNNYENIKEYKEKFSSSIQITKKAYQFQHLIEILEVLVLYVEDNKQEAKEKLKKADTANISMPSTLKAINIILNNE